MCISSSRVAVRGPLQHCAHPHPNPDDVGVLILRAALPSIDGCGHMECGAARKGCDVDDTPGPPTAATANPAALPPQHGETLRLLVTAVELDRTGAKAGPHGRLLDVMS